MLPDVSGDDTTPGPTVGEDRQDRLTNDVVASFAGARSDRFRIVLQSLVRHLHAFQRDVRLTQDEWLAAIEFLTRAGHITDDRRQEFVLLSDVLGASMLTIGINPAADARVTESTVFGPFFVPGSPEIELGGDLSFGASGQPCWIEGRVTDVTGHAVAGARMEVWEADAEGLYDVQHDAPRTANRGHLFADVDGGYRFWAVRPSAYPIPADGPVGDLLTAAGRGPMRPAHVHFMVSAHGYATLITHVFVAGDEHLADDAVFGVKDSLVAPFVDRTGSAAPPGGPDGGAWSSLAFDFVLAVERPDQ